MTEIKNKQCPFCGEYIPLDSEICKYCKESLVNNVETSTPPTIVAKIRNNTWLNLVFV